MLYPGPPGSPTGTLYEVVGEVALVQNPPTAAGPSQHGGGSRPASFGRAPERNRSSQVRWKSTGSVRSRIGQSPVPGRTSDRSRTPDKARTPVRRRTPNREATPDRDKAPVTQASPAFPPDCQMVEPFIPLPSRAGSTRDPWTTIILGKRNPEQRTGSDPSLIQSIRKENTNSGTPEAEKQETLRTRLPLLRT